MAFAPALRAQLPSIPHQSSALRMTELAAGTDPALDPGLSPSEGVAPTPTFPATPAKASAAEICSLARRENRGREDIESALMMLRDWYGVTHAPSLSPEGQRAIQILEAMRRRRIRSCLS